jgi:hypothetical protein
MIIRKLSLSQVFYADPGHRCNGVELCFSEVQKAMKEINQRGAANSYICSNGRHMLSLRHYSPLRL